MQSDNLISLKDDMVAFIAGHGMRRMNGYIPDDIPSVLFEEENPDGWKDFVELAKASGAPFLTMSDVVLEKADVAALIERVRDQVYPDDESQEIEEAERLERRRGSEADDAGVKVFQHLPPQVIDGAVAFVGDDEVKHFNGRACAVLHDRVAAGGPEPLEVQRDGALHSAGQHVACGNALHLYHGRRRPHVHGDLGAAGGAWIAGNCAPENFFEDERRDAEEDGD